MVHTKLFGLLILAMIFIASTSLYSEDSPPYADETFALHFKGGYVLNFFTADFKSFQGSVDCGLFKDGKGNGFSAFLFGELPLSSSIHLGLGVGYVDRSGKLSLDTSFPSYNSVQQIVETVHTENTLDANLGFLEISPEIRITLLDKLINGPLRFMLGFRAGIPITKKFEQKENIKSPDGFVFIIDGRQVQERDVSSGDIETMNTPLYGASAGFENMLNIGNGNYLTQQVVFDYNFNDITSDATWKSFALRFEVGLRFSFEKSPYVPEPEPDDIVPEDTVPVVAKDVAPPIPKLAIDLKETDLELQTGNELLASAPIVNAVFFNRSSSVIPSYYVTDKEFKGSSLGADPVSIHKQLLPRIASIVKKNKQARITLEGATSGRKFEKEGKKLAKKRAHAVKNALVKLGVPSRIITVRALSKPNYPSNQEFDEGIAENQRVDIIVKKAPLQEYVNLQNYAELNGSVYLDVGFSNIPVDQDVNLVSSFTDRTLKCKAPGTYAVEVKNRVDDKENDYDYYAQLKSGEESILYTNNVILSELPKKQVELNLDNFEAILRFDYNSSKLSFDNQGLLKQLVDLLPEGSTIYIYGSTDALGTEERNVQLETERASVTERYIRKQAGRKLNIKIGKGIKKYPEETPQGRFLNRSIRIKVK